MFGWGPQCIRHAEGLGRVRRASSYVTIQHLYYRCEGGLIMESCRITRNGLEGGLEQRRPHQDQRYSKPFLVVLLVLLLSAAESSVASVLRS